MADERTTLCGLAVVHPWLCDAMGHLTTRHYMAMFDDAGYHLFAELGHDAAAGKRDGQGWADVAHQIEYRSELAAGALVRIDGRVTALGRTSIGTELVLRDRDDGRICALLTARTVCFDLVARKSCSLPPALVARARALYDLED